MTPKERAEWIWDYYKVVILLVLALASGGVFLLRDVQRVRKDVQFSVILAYPNGMTIEEKQIEVSCRMSLKNDSENGQIEVLTAAGNGYGQASAKIAAWIRAGRADLLICPADLFAEYAAAGYLKEIPESLTESVDQNRLFYAKQRVYEAGPVRESAEDLRNTGMEEAQCFGIYLTGEANTLVAGIPVNGPHPGESNLVLAGLIDEQRYKARD